VKNRSGPWLLDVNLLLAWLWPTHAYHSEALKWLAQHRGQEWATCPFTENGFLRIVSNPAFSQDSPSVSEAQKILQEQLRPETGHRFWPADISCAGAGKKYLGFVCGHQQITDSYLLALAVRNKGCLVTRDRRINALAPPGSPAHSALLVLP